MLADANCTCAWLTRSAETAELSAAVSDISPASYARSSLTLDVDDFLQHVVRRGDHSGVGGIGALRDDHLRELLGDIDVRALDRARTHRAGTAGARVGDAGGAAVEGLGEGLAVLALQCGRVVELRQRHAEEHRARAVVVV